MVLGLYAIFVQKIFEQKGIMKYHSESLSIIFTLLSTNTRKALTIKIYFQKLLTQLLWASELASELLHKLFTPKPNIWG